MTTPRRSVERCTFCEKRRHAVDSLIAGPPGVYICNECIEICNSILPGEAEQRAPKPKASAGRPAGDRGEARPAEGRAGGRGGGHRRRHRPGEAAAIEIARKSSTST